MKNIILNIQQALTSENRKETATKTTVELKRMMRSKLELCSDPREDVMSKYYGITSNKCKPIRAAGEIPLWQIVQRHGTNGFVLISALRPECDDESNSENTKALLRQIKQSGYRFLPIYAKRSSQNDSENIDYQPLFFVFNYDREHNFPEFSSLYKYALKWCRDYAQDCVLIKAPWQQPVCVNSSGEEVKDDNENRGEQDTDDCHFEYYVNPIPQNLKERMRRGNERYAFMTTAPGYFKNVS